MKKLLFLILFMPSVYAQTKEDKIKIIQKTDVETLTELKNSFNTDYISRKERIESFLKNNPNFQAKFSENGVDKEIYDINESGEIIYYHTTNLLSSITANADKVYNGGAMGLNLQGQNMVAGVWDSGPVRETHVEFPNFKISPFDYSATYSNHGTHVMGTIVASGTNANARGIAFQANGDSYDWNNDYSEMSGAAASGLLVSNHSYWIGSSLSTWILGAYDSRAQQMDQITYAAPYYLPVVAAGNDRNNTSNTILNNHLQNKFGYDLIRGMNNAKNSLTVGAVNSVPFYIDQSSVQMSSFSSWGPTDDGRIKPEIVAKGVSVFSPVGDTDASYDTYQGTSMASPAVAGVCLLLQQHYNNLFSNYMLASSLKGLVLHTARDAGFYDGPDYEFGWGLIDAAGAASLISSKSNGNSIIDELVLTNGATYTRDIFVSSVSDLKVSISWTDKAAPVSLINNGVVDPSVSYLVNDLDLKLTKATETFYPWSLDKISPFNQATNLSQNNVDIFERVDVDQAVGLYTITVSHKGNLDANGQVFSLIVSGQNLTLNNKDFESNDLISVYPNPASEILNIQSTLILDGAKVEIYDMLGKNIYKNTLLNNSIDISTFDTGIYMLNITTDEGTTYVKKFIKK